MRINIENLKKIQFESKEELAAFIFEKINQEDLSILVNNSDYDQNENESQSFCLEIESHNKEKITQIEELDFFDQNLENNNFRLDLFKFFEELLSKLPQDSHLKDFIENKKEYFLQEYLHESSLETKKLRDNAHTNNHQNNNFFKRHRHANLSCDAVLDSENSKQYANLNLLNQKIEILEQSNFQLLKEISEKKQFEKELEAKLSELSVKTTKFFQMFENKREQVNHLNELVKKKNLFILKTLDQNLNCLLEENQNFHEFNFLKINLLEKRKDLRKVLSNDNLICKEEIIEQELDKTLKTLIVFFTNFKNVLFEKMEEKEKNQLSFHAQYKINSVKESIKINENCKLCKLF